MHRDYTRCYETLDLLPGAEWSDVRTTYKNLVGRWHPDRFPNDAARRRLAEEKIKDITEAYRAIEEYYRQHGATPAPPKPFAPAPIPQDFTVSAATHADTLDSEPIYAPDAVRDSPHAHRTLMWILLMGAVLMLIYLLTEDDEHPAATPSYEESRSNADIVPVSSADVTADESNKAPRFTVGSTLGDVYAAQGIPTKIEGDTWHYGESAVRFVKGKVTNWTEHSANPLRADLDGASVTLRASMFGPGSTKTEVRKIQGNPSRETEAVWEYGTSKVFFKGDRVTSWHESPLFPLRAAK